MSKKFPTPKKFEPMFPEKYIGDVNQIISRSSWETKLFKWCDLNENVLSWNSEDIIIPYFSNADGKKRRYHIDVYMRVKTKTGQYKQYLIEVKPYVQTQKPKNTKRKKKETYLKECYDYQVNSDKWQHAIAWAKERDMEFIIMTEYELGIKKKPVK